MTQRHGRTCACCSPPGKNSATMSGRCCADLSPRRSGTRGGRALTLARDQLGLNVVMWHRERAIFRLRHHADGLFALDDVPRELSEEKLADFLVLNHADHADDDLPERISRPARACHAASQPTARSTQRRFWSPAEIKPVRLSSDQAYAEGLRDCLDRAVRRQMRSAHPIGSLLSGGLDSSSVSALAARALGEKNERLAAFTGVPRRGFDGAVPAGALRRRNALRRRDCGEGRQYRRHLYPQQRT